MTRRRRDDQVFVVDLSSDGDLVGPADGSADDEPGDGGADGGRADGSRGDDEAAARGGRTRRQSVLQATAAGAVLVLGVGAWGVVSARNAAAETARLSGAPGGVLSLAEPPEPLWEASTDDHSAVQALPGLLVARDGTQLVGRGAADGSERWRVEVGGDPQCGGSTSSPSSLPADDARLVCWSGPNAEQSSVVVVDSRGLVSRRDLPDEAEATIPGPGGTVVTARHLGPQPPEADLRVTDDGGGWSVEGTVTDTRDVLVRVEDAVTGDVRWEHQVPFRPVEDVAECAQFVWNGDDQLPTADMRSLGLGAGRDYVLLSGCGTYAVLSVDGRLLSDPSSTTETQGQQYPDGGFAASVVGYGSRPAASGVLFRPDGAVEVFDDDLLSPWATDGTPSDLRLTGGYGSPLRAFTPDGTELWNTGTATSAVLVRAAGVVVALTEDGTTVGVDLDTGEQLWSDDELLRTPDAQAGSWPAGMVRAAFTDGVSAAFALASDESGTVQRLVAIDLATGEQRWDVPLDQGGDGTGLAQLAAAAGHLVLTTPTSDPQGAVIAREDGQYVLRAPGTVRVLG